jgi:hypothetical protein
LLSWSRHQWPGRWLTRPARVIITLINCSVIRPLSLGTSSTVAPNASSVRRFASLNASEKTAWSP